MPALLAIWSDVAILFSSTVTEEWCSPGGVFQNFFGSSEPTTTSTSSDLRSRLPFGADFLQLLHLSIFRFYFDSSTTGFRSRLLHIYIFGYQIVLLFSLLHWIFGPELHPSTLSPGSSDYPPDTGPSSIFEADIRQFGRTLIVRIHPNISSEIIRTHLHLKNCYLFGFIRIVYPNTILLIDRIHSRGYPILPIVIIVCDLPIVTAHHGRYFRNLTYLQHL